MNGRLDGKVALVIGGARGIGGGIVSRFAEEGASVVVADLEEDAGTSKADEVGGHYVKTDISKAEDATRMVEEALAKFGRLDIMVQNAGIYPWNLIEDISPQEWAHVLAVNLGGCFNAAQAALKPMKQQKSGRMLFTSSITGPYVTVPGHGHYAASKAGINGFIRTAALEFSHYGITVNGVEPGNILTEGMKAHRSQGYIDDMAASIPLGRLGTPEDVANAYLFLASDEASFVTGTTIVVDGGQLLPEGHDFQLRQP